MLAGVTHVSEELSVLPFHPFSQSPRPSPPPSDAPRMSIHTNTPKRSRLTSGPRAPEALISSSRRAAGYGLQCKLRKLDPIR